MEAATLKKKKNTVNKPKMKKTIKNILCRPDPIIWPIAIDEHCKQIKSFLDKHKIEVPVYVKPHWSEVRNTPKAERPKAPKRKKIEGLIFGLSHCARTITSGDCKAIVLDNAIDPKILVHHIIESCNAADIPVICINDLKKITTNNFGFPTCCLGIKKGCLEELLVEIRKIAKFLTKQKNVYEEKIFEKEITEKVDADIDFKSEDSEIPFTYLYRTSKTSRVFTPESCERVVQNRLFSGQEFIKVVDGVKDIPKRTFYKNMYMKRVTNNPNRLKKKQSEKK